MELIATIIITTIVALYRDEETEAWGNEETCPGLDSPPLSIRGGAVPGTRTPEDTKIFGHASSSYKMA